MAAAAKAENQIEKKTLEAFLERYEGMEDDAVSIMTTAMKACKDGPRADQKDLRAEMKNSGVRMKTFNAMWEIRKAARKTSDKVAELEDDDLDQMRQFAITMKGTPMGDMMERALDEPKL